jgi:hypothetical protein
MLGDLEDGIWEQEKWGKRGSGVRGVGTNIGLNFDGKRYDEK